MRADDEACDLCGAAAGQPHRLRCTRVIDEQMEAHEFEQGAGAQGALIGGVVAGVAALVAGFVFTGSMLISFGGAAALGGGVHEVLRRMVDSRRDAKAKQTKQH
jgi:hypothetical protein